MALITVRFQWPFAYKPTLSSSEMHSMKRFARVEGNLPSLQGSLPCTEDGKAHKASPHR